MAQKRFLTNDQRFTYDTIIEHVRGGNGEFIFLDAPGKTYVFKLILAETRMKHEIDLTHGAFGYQAVIEFKSSCRSSLQHWKNISNGNCIENMPNHYLR